ncbi:MAG: hypothetical protein HDT02_04845 [Bacteroidales bacterium]|nr:hypothetical protein [Bacteroidales bacterium]
MKKTLLALAAVALGAMTANAATVYFNNEGTDWTSVYGYSWTPDYLEELSAVTIDGHTLYAAELNNAEIIFRGSNTVWADDLQTSNLEVVDGAVYGSASIKANGGSIDPIANVVDGKYVTSTSDDEFPVMFLVGAMTGWGNSNAYKFKTTDGVNYSLTASIEANQEFKIYGGAWGTRELTCTQKKLENGTYTFEPGDANTSLARGGDVTIKFVQENNFSSAKVTISGQEGGDTPVETVVYLAGDFNAWSTTADQFTTTDGIHFTYKIDALPEGFKLVVDGSWFGYDEAKIAFGETYLLSSSNGVGNCELLDQEATDLTLSFNAETFELTITGTPVGGGDDPEPTEFYGIHGNIFGDPNWSTLPLVLTDGLWVGEANCVAGSFGIKIMDADGNQTAWKGGGAKVTEAGVEYSLNGILNSSSTLEGGYEIIYNPSANTIKFIAKEVEHNYTYVLKGTIFDGAEWIEQEMEETAEGWTWTGDVVAGTFGVMQADNGAQSDWFGAANSASAMNSVGTFEATNYGLENWESTLEGTYKFTFNPETVVLTVSDPSGVAEINLENGEVIYFNLQGQRVAEPANGVFIRVENGKAIKIAK